jgi:hypothetical protein
VETRRAGEGIRGDHRGQPSMTWGTTDRDLRVWIAPNGFEDGLDRFRGIGRERRD